MVIHLIVGPTKSPTELDPFWLLWLFGEDLNAFICAVNSLLMILMCMCPEARKQRQ